MTADQAGNERREARITDHPFILGMNGLGLCEQCGGRLGEHAEEWVPGTGLFTGDVSTRPVPSPATPTRTAERAWEEGFKAGGRWMLLDDEWYEDSQIFDETDLPPRPPKPANPYAAAASPVAVPQSVCPNPMAHDRAHHTHVRHNLASGGWTAECIDCRWDSGHNMSRELVQERALDHEADTDPDA